MSAEIKSSSASHEKKEETEEPENHSSHENQITDRKIQRQLGLFGRTQILAKCRPFDLVETKLKLSVDETIFYKQWIEKDAKQQEEIANYEQGTEKWKMSRRYRVTGSKFADAVGHSPYSTPDEAAKSIIEDKFKGNKATQRGNKLEPKACAWVLERERKFVMTQIRDAQSNGCNTFMYANRTFEIPADWPADKEVYEIQHRGLIIMPESPWIAASSDGDIFIFGKFVGQIEIKCPSNNFPYPLIPAYYFDQIQGNMHISGSKFCLFISYTESKVISPVVEHIEYDATYCNEFLFPALNRFWFTKLMPAAMTFEKNKAVGPGVVACNDDEEGSGGGSTAFELKKPKVTRKRKSTVPKQAAAKKKKKSKN